jgi:hypothetical protein
MTIETITLTGDAVARALIQAREACNTAAAAGVPWPEIERTIVALEDALDRFTTYRCRDTADLNAYATALWWYVANVKAQIDPTCETPAEPLAEFYPVAEAVQREMERLLST